MKRLLACLAPIVALAIAGPVGAADISASVQRKAPTADTKEEAADRFAMFYGFDFTSQSRYAGYQGATIAPFGNLDTSGVRIWLLGEMGTYKTHAEDNTINRGMFTAADLLIGYGIERDKLSAALFLGPNIESHRLTEPDPDNPVQGTKVGVKIRGELSLNPTDLTWVFGEASYSTAFRTYFSKLKFGYDVSNGKEIFVGPEVIALGNEQFNEWRIGVHVTGIQLRKATVGFSAGYLHENEWGHGAYGIIELDFKF